MSAAIDAPTLHLDGAFQTASALFRLDSGQFPGRDFFPYLGIGPLLSLYPAFKVFGSNLAASVIAAHFMTLVLCWLSASILWHLILRPASILASLAAGAFFFGVLVVVADHFAIHPDDALGFASGPGLSLRPIRAAAPYLVVACYYLFILKLQSASLRSALCGVVTGAILLWSNDFAVPSAGFLAMLVAFDTLAGSERNWRNAFLYAATAAVSWFALLGLATLGHPVEMLRYNFLDVAADQWWYFTPYEEGSRVFEPQHIFRIETPYGHFAVAILALASIAAIWTRRIEHALVAWIGFVLLAGGVVACVGGHVGRYFAGFFLWAVCTSLFALFACVDAGVGRYFRRVGRSWPDREMSAAVVALALLLAMAALDGRKYRASLIAARSDPARFHVPELGAYLRAEWIEYVDLARKTDTRKVLEEYWGIWSATRKIIPGWPVDSVIHALGRTREVARSTLKDADVIISTRYATSSEWQPWSLAQNFWFYDELIGNWTPREASPTTVVWRRNKTPREDQGVECRAEGAGKSLVLNVAAPGFHRVTLEYEFSGAGRHLLLVKNNLPSNADSEGYVSINPGGRSASFPAYISRAGLAVLDSRVVGSAPHELQIRACRASRISLADDEVLHVPGSITDSFYMTDDIWSRGVARDWAGFFVPNTDPFVREYRTGRVVTLADGDTRAIVRVEPRGAYLNVYLEGAPLNPRRVGLPSAYSVSDGNAFYLTDRNWSYGVSRQWAGFFQPNTEEITRKYRPGRVVVLADGEMRRIDRVEPHGRYLYVFLEGALLDPGRAGVPGSYSVRD